MIKHQKIVQFIVGILIVVAISFPNIAQMSPIIYAGAGCGGYGANTGAGIKTSAAGAHCDWCACWCGHLEYCNPPWLNPKVPVPMSWLSDGKTCSCPTAGGGSSSQGSGQSGSQSGSQSGATQSTRQTGSLTPQQARSMANKLSNELDYKRGGDPWSGKTDCSGGAERFVVDSGGADPGRSTYDMIKSAEYQYSTARSYINSGNLQPGDIIVRGAGGVAGNHAGVYIGNGMVWNSMSGGFRAESLGSFLSRGGSVKAVNLFTR